MNATDSNSTPLTETGALSPMPLASESRSHAVLPTPEERVRKVYVRDLREKDRVTTVFRVTKKNRQVSRSGKAFLTFVLTDKTGDVDGRVFDAVAQLDPAFAVNDYVLVEGHVVTHQGRPQVIAEKIDRLDPEPIDSREFTPSYPSADGTVSQIRELVQRVHDPHVKQLLLAFLDDPAVARGLPNAPAAKGIHHAYRGGLAEHILSVIRLAHRIADQYPMADRDLLVAGALLHDIGKVTELSYERGEKGFDYSDEGRLVGHIVMTAQKIREKAAAITNFPALLEHHLTHIVLSHHGQLEYGSPKLPMTLEAMLVHYIDTIDSKVASWLELMEKDQNDRWTEPSRLYDRRLWKGSPPTQRNRSPLEGRGNSRRNRDRDPGHGRKARAANRAPATEDAAIPRELAFKPLSALTTDLPPAENASPPESAEGRGQAKPE